MNSRPNDDQSRSDWPRAVALAALTAVGVYLCYLLTVPFLPGLTWALALAVVALPLHRVVSRVITNRSWAAGLSTTLVVLVIGVPVVLVAARLAAQTTRVAEIIHEESAGGRWREHLARVPYVGGQLSQVDPAEIEARVREVANQIASRSLGMVQGLGGAVLQALVAVFVLYFALRDRHTLLGQVRKFIPLTPEAGDRVIGRAEDAIHATVYGTVLTSVLQGVTGGLLFWALGLPAPVLWGAVMVVVGILPFVGAFLVWVPAAIYLATEDRWGAAVAVVAWGLIMAGPVTNYLYATVAGDRMRMHPVPTLIAFVGGLAVFGVSGMILGPCILAVTVALLAIWRHRAADGIPVDAQSDNTVIPAHSLSAPITR